MQRSRLLWGVYSALGAVLVAYVVSLLVRQNNSSELVDGWLVAAFELVGSGLCFIRGLAQPQPSHRSRSRWGSARCVVAGDLFLTLESSGGGTPPVALGR